MKNHQRNHKKKQLENLTSPITTLDSGESINVHPYLILRGSITDKLNNALLTFL